MFSVHNYQQGVQRLLAACDAELLGTSYREGERRLDVSEQFYGGSDADEEQLRGFLGQCTMANLVGDKVINVAVGLGLIDPANIQTVQGVPHAQYMLLM